MTDDDNTMSLQEQLAAHRRTLAHLLTQRAYFDPGLVPSHVAHGIDEARREIARLKTALRDAGVAVEDQAGDVATAEEMAGPVGAPTCSANIYGDKFTGDKVMGDKHEHHHHHPQPRPTIDPVQAQQLLDRLPLDQIPDPIDLPPGSRMALLRNPLFVGREDDLRAIAKNLKDGRAAAITTGIGGVGKTQLASEFAHRYGQYFAGGVFWLSFADPAGIDAEIAACGGAGALELYTDAQGLTQAEQVARVYTEWAQPIPRLLIFDNCEDEALLAQRMPRSGGCRVLVTSRRGQWSRGLGIVALPLGVLSRAESIALLRSHRGDIGDDEANAIAAELGDLPLALSLAGNYLETYRADSFGVPATYLASLRAQLLAHRSMQGAGAGPSLTDHELNVRATFALSYQRLDAADSVDALAIAALARAAHLAPGEPFPRQLLLATLGDATDDEEVAAQRADALRRLVALGLLEVAEDGALRIHRLIAAFAREAIEDDEAQPAVDQALATTGNRLVNAGYPAQLQPILAHLRHATIIADPRGDAQAGELANTHGRAEQMLANYAAARPLFERALHIREQALGSQHLDTVRSLNNLAILLESQGDYATARPLFERALSIHEQALGSQHSDTAQSLNNLAVLLYSQGDYATARPLFERALSIREQALGSQHPDTAQSLNNLANLLRSQGDYATARPLFERALSIREQALGSQHPDTAQSLNNLAILLESQGDYAAARPLYEHVVQIFEQALGSQHPNTATSLNNLAGLLRAQGDYAAARPLFERALSIHEQALGSQHPDTARSLNNLASLLQSQGDYATARPLFERALSIRERALGSQHSDTAQSLNNLAILLESQGDYTAARPLFERALSIRERALGSQHPDTAQSLNNLADLLQSQGDYAAARPLFERALSIREQALGLQHPDTARSLNNLAILLGSQGDYAAAQPLFERVVQIFEQALGSQHPDTAQSLNNLAILLESQGDYAAARSLYERALLVTEQALGSQHPNTAQSLNNLASLLQSQGDYATARPLFERALTICEQHLGIHHPNTRTIRANLAALDAPPPTAAQQITEITAQAEATVAMALADLAIDRAALAEQLEATAQQVEAAGPPYLTLAIHLRTLAAQLIAPPDDA